MKKFSKRLLALLPSALSAALLAFAVSCTERQTNEVFKKPALERLQENMSFLHAKLQASPQGWVMHYKPSKKETGYYQFLVRFLNDTEVEMASDFSPDDFSWQKSEYTILTGSTAKLSFATRNSIHKLSDSNFSPIPGSAGSGLKGDFEFLYYGETPQGDLLFRTNRTNDTLRFKKATDKSLEGMRASFDNFNRLRYGKSVYRAVSELKGGVVHASVFSFPYDARIMRIQGVAETTVDGAIKKSFNDGYISGFGLTSEGIFFDSLMRHSGKILRNVAMKYNQGTGQFETVLADGTFLSVGDVNAPIIPTDDQKYFLDPKLTAYLVFLYKDVDMGVDISDLTTPAFNALLDKLKPIGLGDSPKFELFRQYVFDAGKTDCFMLEGTISVSDEETRQYLIYEDKGDRLVITSGEFVRPKDSIKPEYESQYNDFMNFLTDPQGFYVKDLGKVTKYQNHVFTFTSVKDPSIQFAVHQVAPE